MRLNLTLLVLILLLASGACRQDSHSVPQAILGAMLIDGTPHPPIADSVVLVRHGKVEAAGPAGSIAVPDGFHRIQARGRFLFPIALSQTIRVGEEANLLLLSVNPAADPDYQKKVIGRMESGRWVQYPQ